MSGRSVRAAKWRATMARLGPTLPDRPQSGWMPRTTSGAERAATIAAEDAAREAAGRLPQAVLNHLATSCMFRARAVAPLTDFATGNHAPAGGTSSRAPANGKSPR